MLNHPVSVVMPDDPLLSSEFMQEMVKQLRALDRYGVQDSSSAAQLMDPLILTKERKKQLAIVGDPDEDVTDRLQAFYNATATLIEKRSGLPAVPLVHLTYEGFGRVVITVGRLVVLDRVLRDVHRFGFRSLAKLQEEGNTVVNKALALIQEYPQVAEL